MRAIDQPEWFTHRTHVSLRAAPRHFGLRLPRNAWVWIVLAAPVLVLAALAWVIAFHLARLLGAV